MLFEPVVASLPSSTITGTSAADVRSTTPGTNALVDTYAAADTITLNNEGDYSLSGDGADLIRVGGSASVSLSNSVVAGAGNDTISLATASSSLATVAGNFGGNQGDDYITFSAAATTSILNSSFIGAGLNSDTIAITNVSQSINSEIKGGDHGDSISVATGILTNSLIAGNKGADTIRVGITASTDGSVGGGSGHDTIAIGTAQLAGISWVNAGAGYDSIRVDNASTISSLSGGGLADTISFRAAFAGGIIYGDAAGVEAAGSGTGGTTDGADLIGSSGTDVSLAASVYGTGGNDTIKFNTAVTAVNLYGGDGAI